MRVMLKRNITGRALAALADTPVVLIHGARQTGKSTLVKYLASEHISARYVTLDDAAVLAAANSDPEAFLERFDGPVAIDEVQRAPGLFMAIKAAVDRDRRPGRFLLTGSANVLAIPRISESLAGRTEILTLHPFSQGELASRQESFIDGLFGKKLPESPAKSEGGRRIAQRALRGGYPEVQLRKDVDRVRAWFESYVSTIVQRDLRDLGDVSGLTSMPRLLEMLAVRAGTFLNRSDIGRALGLPLTTLRRYLSMLETAFLFQPLPYWAANLEKRLVKSPKIYLGDSGLLAHLLKLHGEEEPANTREYGALLENFVVSELRKDAEWGRARPGLFHFRTTHSAAEVDVVMEGTGRSVVGLEVKAGARVRKDDFKGLHVLAEQVKDRFHRGVVLYTGRETVSFGPRMYAMPIDSLWA